MRRADMRETTIRNRRRVRLTAAISAACLLAACSGSSDAGPSSVAPATEPITAPPTDEPEATTTSSTTSTTTTTSTTMPLPVVDTVPSSVGSEPQPDTTLAPAPSPIPTNTMFDPATPEGEVEQATLSNLIAYSECLSQLPNCDPQKAMRFALLAYAEGNAETIAGWNADGLEIRNVKDWVYDVESVEFSDDGTEAIVYTCSFDGSQLIQPATDTSAEKVVDAGNVSNKSKYLVRRISESWFVTAKESIETLDGRVTGYCG